MTDNSGSAYLWHLREPMMRSGSQTTAHFDFVMSDGSWYSNPGWAPKWPVAFGFCNNLFCSGSEGRWWQRNPQADSTKYLWRTGDYYVGGAGKVCAYSADSANSVAFGFSN